VVEERCEMTFIKDLQTLFRRTLPKGVKVTSDRSRKEGNILADDGLLSLR
jgi:hypothetical protein